MRPVPGANATFRVPIDRESAGIRNLVQRVFVYGPGESPEMKNEESEDTLYVVRGTGEAVVAGETFPLVPATGLLAPAGVPYLLRNPGPEPLEIVSVISPQPGRPASVPPSPMALPIGLRGMSAHEREQEPLPAGDDRTFKLMIDPRYGSKYVTQFLGFIEKSAAPPHTHTYEEVIYILGGSGVVHIEEGDYPIEAGSSIYLPPGTSHCLENKTNETLRLLGVFCPAGSPADKMMQEMGRVRVD